MSGICVLIHKSRDRAAERAELEAMLRPAAGKGPFAIKTSGNAGIGFFDTFGGDPQAGLFEDERFLVAMDGETYNHRDFPEGKAEGYSEAALVAALFRKHGQDWWKQVHGTYGAFVWDKQERKGWAFRDRIGVRPLVYCEEAGQVLIATRIRSISARPGFKREVDPQAVFSYLNMEMIPTPFTIFKGVIKLESGHNLEVTPAGVRAGQAWIYPFPADKIKEAEEMKERTRALLKESVRMMAGHREPLGEVGAFLSGGTDSSSIAGLFEENFPGNTKTFSMGFNETGFDEMYYCRIAAQAFKTQQNEYYVTPEDILSALPSIVEAYDEPFANSSAIPSYLCARMAREKGMRVMLGGDGGDEIFGGNSRYRDLLGGFQRFPSWLQDGVMAPVLGMLPEALKVGPIRPLDRYIRRATAPLHEKIHCYGLDYYLDPKDVFASGFLNGNHYVTPAQISKGYLDKTDAVDPIDRYMANDIKITLADNDLPKINGMTELAGIKVRYPFLDHALVEMTGRIPAAMKVKDGRLRYIFKEAMRGLLPDEIIEKKKHGFGIPVARWMVRPGPLNDLVKDVIHDSKTAGRGFFQKSFLEKIYRLSGQDKTTYYGTYLYYVFFLEMWMRKHADAA
jgi:asparagine synthase (glutamine-hydrolysing)